MRDALLPSTGFRPTWLGGARRRGSPGCAIPATGAVPGVAPHGGHASPPARGEGTGGGAGRSALRCHLPVFLPGRLPDPPGRHPAAGRVRLRSLLELGENISV